jgi:hypothetical protein
LKSEGVDVSVVAAVAERLGPVADHMINHNPDRKDAQYFN